jgi:hypothetical protein
MRYVSQLLLVYLMVLYFDFIPQSYLLRRNGEVYVDLFHKVPPAHTSNLKVRAVTNIGIVYLFDDKSNKWVYSSDFWTTQPLLSSRMKLRVKSVLSPIQLRLEVLDTTTGKVYSTVSKKFWTNQLPAPKVDTHK